MLTLGDTRSFFTKALLYGAAFHLWSSFILARFDDDTHDAAPSTEPSLTQTASQRSSTNGDDLAEDESEDGLPLFIPLTWSRQQEGELYSRSDPEWHRFVQIGNDGKKLQELRDELAAIVLKSVSRRMGQLLGAPLSLNRSWLLQDFPLRAPPTYLRSGFEITDDGISWATKPLDPGMGDRLQNFMKPVHVVLAIKDAYLMLLNRQFNRLRDPPGQPADVLELLGKDHALSSNEQTNPLVSHGQSKWQPPNSDIPPEKVTSTMEPGIHPSSIISSLQRFPLPNLGPGSDLHLASMVFRVRLDEYQARAPRTPLRGTFFMSGPVGISGPYGFCRFEVRGEYDPAKPGWRTVDIELKDMHPWRQDALGGR